MGVAIRDGSIEVGIYFHDSSFFESDGKFLAPIVNDTIYQPVSTYDSFRQ